MKLPYKSNLTEQKRKKKDQIVNNGQHFCHSSPRPCEELAT